MIVIRCPYCHEERCEDELVFGGQADVVRAADPSAQTDDEWTEYLYMRDNPKGVHYEQWCCAAGCGQWFKVARDAVTHTISEVILFDEKYLHQQEVK